MRIELQIVHNVHVNGVDSVEAAIATVNAWLIGGPVLDESPEGDKGIVASSILQDVKQINID